MNKKDGFLDLFLHFFLSGSYNLYYLITKRNFKFLFGFNFFTFDFVKFVSVLYSDGLIKFSSLSFSSER